MVDSLLIESLQLPAIDQTRSEALRYVLEHDVSPDVKFLASTILSDIHTTFNESIRVAGLGTEYLIEPTDSVAAIRRKCKLAYNQGVGFNPMFTIYAVDESVSPEEVASGSPDLADEGLYTAVDEYVDYALSGFETHGPRRLPIVKRPLTLGFADDESGLKRPKASVYDIDEEKTSTERVRKYYRKHPGKVREYLKKTVKDRAARNRDRSKAVAKYGKSKMKNHDVHHPNGPKKGNWRLAKKDHGPDKKNESYSPDKMASNIQHFIQYAIEHLNLKQTPNITLLPAAENMTSLGGYNPTTHQIYVVIEGRLLADILRTLAHELTHQKQREMGYIQNPEEDGKTGSSVENAANAVAGILLRDYGLQNRNIFLSENTLLTEGGAAGHLAHPFEDETLTFKDMKEMVNRGLLGGLDAEAPVTEKLDGQNIAFSVRDGQIIFARNKGQLKSRGKNALDVAGIRQMFAGRGNIEKAFTAAAQDLQSATKRLSSRQIARMFGEGSKFMSLEVILPDTQNVIPYGKSVLVMHGTIEYDENGEEIGRSMTDGREFAGALRQVGEHQQDTFGISGPRTIVFSDADSEEYQKKAEDYTARLDRAAQSFGLDDSSTLAEYRQAWWGREIDQLADREGIQLSPEERDGLIGRWADGDKKFGVKHFEDPAKKKWFRSVEKELPVLYKTMIRPIESTFLQVGTDSLRRVTNFLAANNPGASAQLKKDTLEAIKAIRDSEQPDKIAKLQHELERLEGMGIDNIVPSEGVVFVYNGKPYKFTGTFAPINQITGTFKFSLPPKEKEFPRNPPGHGIEATKSTSAEPTDWGFEDDPPPWKTTPRPEKTKRTVAIFSGRFQPFHAGHYSIYKALVKKFGKHNVFVASSGVTDAVRSPFEFRDRQEIMSRMFGIPEDQIVQVKNPYAPEEILSKLPDNTAYVTAVSQKDADRLGSRGKYFAPYKNGKSADLKPYKDAGYFIVAPELKLQIGGKNISGTALRAALGDPRNTERAKKEIFTKAYGKFDQKIFDKMVKITSQAEEARKLTDTHGKPAKKKSAEKKIAMKAAKKTPDAPSMERARSVLKQKIKNPKTGRSIYVATALGYNKDEPVKQAADRLVRKAMGKKKVREEILTESKDSNKLQVYIHVRDYTSEEMTNEIGEYFENEYTYKTFPELANTPEELKQKILAAPTEVLTKDELLNLDNGEVADVLTSKKPTEVIKKIAVDYNRDIKQVVHAFKNEIELPLPIVIKHPTGYFLMAGNTRLSVLAAMRYTMPVKVLEYDHDTVLDTDQKKSEKKFKKHLPTQGSKATFKKVLQMKILNPETGNEIKIDTAMDYNRMHPAHKIALNTIRQHMQKFSNRAGIPKHLHK